MEVNITSAQSVDAGIHQPMSPMYVVYTLCICSFTVVVLKSQNELQLIIQPHA